MAGYSSTPLAAKLGVQPGADVLVDAAGAAEVPLPDLGHALVTGPDAPGGVRLRSRLPPRAGLVLTFHLTRAGYARRLPVLEQRLPDAGTVWVCWPKKAAWPALASVADVAAPARLDENAVRDLALATGLVDVKVAAIDDVWSGLKLVRRVADRGGRP